MIFNAPQRGSVTCYLKQGVLSWAASQKKPGDHNAYQKLRASFGCLDFQCLALPGSLFSWLVTWRPEQQFWEDLQGRDSFTAFCYETVTQIAHGAVKRINSLSLSTGFHLRAQVTFTAAGDGRECIQKGSIRDFKSLSNFGTVEVSVVWFSVARAAWEQAG